MPRATPPDRWERLIDAATQVFVAQGYRRTQMADVADALGVAKGTLYLYVESKEALFDLVVRAADAPRPLRLPPSLPLRTPKPGTTLRYVRDRLAAGGRLATLTAALQRKRRSDAGAELRGICEEIYAVLSSNRHGIQLIDRSARDQPELAALWFEGSRGGLVQLLAEYLRRRIGQGALRAVPDVDAAARLILETLAFWAVHRHWDSHPQPIGDEVARDTAVTFVVSALGKDVT
jgi:AcrR family transcriptional regulator